MLTTRRQLLGALLGSATAGGVRLYAQTPGVVKPEGAYLVTSGGDRIDEHFRPLLDTHARKLVFIPTAASSLRSKYGTIWNPDLEENRDAFVRELLLRFNALEVQILHTRSRHVADSEEFVRPLRTAGAVWMSGGNAGRLADAYLDTRVVAELRDIVNRGGIVAGESAGAIIQGSYVVRGNPAKPVLMVTGRERGFGLLPNVAINPHLTASQRETMMRGC
jgi:cyanophycinase